MTTKIAIHESGHALAAHVFDIAIRSVSIRPTATHLGKTYVNASGFESDLDCAIVFVSGPMAERIFEGKSERVNWFADGNDIERALQFIERTPDPLLSRRVAELRSRSLLFTRWPCGPEACRRARPAADTHGRSGRRATSGSTSRKRRSSD